MSMQDELKPILTENELKLHKVYNEAGHTIAYFYFGIPLRSVTIVPDNEGHDGLTTPEERGGIDIEILIMISLAGPVAEKIHLGCVGPGALGDRFAASKYGISMQEMTELETQIEDKLKQPHYYYATKTLVTELSKKPLLTGNEAFSIIETAIKEYKEQNPDVI